MGPCVSTSRTRFAIQRERIHSFVRAGADISPEIELIDIENVYEVTGAFTPTFRVTKSALPNGSETMETTKNTHIHTHARTDKTDADIFYLISILLF